MDAERGGSYQRVSGHDLAALLNPRAAVLITSCDPAGRPNVMTAVWQTPLSHRPPMVGISIAPARYTHGLIAQVGEFVVNVVDEGFDAAVELCGDVSGAQADKFALAGLKTLPAARVRPPLIAGALAHLECRVVQSVTCGDHTLFVGEVLHAQALQGTFEGGWEEPAHVLLAFRRDLFGHAVPAGESKKTGFT